MIIPHPESNLRESIIYYGNEILEKLYKNRSGILIDALLQEFIKKSPDRTQKQFIDTITFLYAADLIKIDEYKIKIKKSVR